MKDFILNFLDPEQWEFVLQIFIALVLSGLIGLEREYRQKPAGFRTHVLVGGGSALFTIISIHGFKEFIGDASFDPSRVAAQILTGIGFIGAGAILRHEDRIIGLTTASGLWITAAIGMAVATKFYAVAIATTALVMVTYFVSKKFLDWLTK